jgi:hypothetical protein
MGCAGGRGHELSSALREQLVHGRDLRRSDTGVQQLHLTQVHVEGRAHLLLSTAGVTHTETGASPGEHARTGLIQLR